MPEQALVARSLGVTSKFTERWLAVTAGERLVHFLANNVAGLRQMNLGALEDLSGVPRGSVFGDFLQGCLVLHCFGRLIQVAKYFRTVYLDAPDGARSRIEQFAAETLDISGGSCANFDQLAILALDAAERSARSSSTPSRSEKRRVLERCHSIFRCYSCDGVLDPGASETRLAIDAQGTSKEEHDPAYLTYDHLWPHSLGGDSIEGNLLPACQFCNVAKQHTASWEWTRVQAFLPETELGKDELESKHLTRETKTALHMRAALEYARRNGTTLKEAYLAIGPRPEKITIVDPADTPDFFNLRGHDLARVGML